MNTSAERILLVESDLEISALIAHQALQPLGYQMIIVGDVNSAITQAAQLAPDLVMADLNLPGLSGKDLLVALNSQGLQVPVIVIAAKGEENKVIQAFRLGATDYLLWPAREPEIVSAVERVLKQVHEQRERQRLDAQLRTTNMELQQRVRELTTIFAVGKAVISITDQRVLFDKIVEGATYVTEADYGWLLLRDDHTHAFILASHRNLPESWARKIGKTLDDGISSLVALSGETLAIHGEPLSRFKVVSLGLSAVVVPIKAQQEVIGLLVMIRKANQAFSGVTQSLLEAVADYASISMVNARLFRALQDNVEAARAGEKKQIEQMQDLQRELHRLLQTVTYPVDLMLADKMGKLTPQQKEALETARASLLKAMALCAINRSNQPAATT
jgi:DNA-binding response OmpR family regulator